jgi:hypothetical protein
MSQPSAPPAVVTVRRATVQDAPALGRVHVRAWQAADGWQLPDDYLHGLRPEERAAGWERGLSRRRDPAPVLVAEEAGRVVGFAALGPAEAPGGAGEVSASNVDPGHWGREPVGPCWVPPRPSSPGWAIGEPVLWVLPGNARARRFYEVAGWAMDGIQARLDIHGNLVTTEGRGRWPVTEGESAWPNVGNCDRDRAVTNAARPADLLRGADVSMASPDA